MSGLTSSDVKSYLAQKLGNDRAEIEDALAFNSSATEHLPLRMELPETFCISLLVTIVGKNVGSDSFCLAKGSFS